MAEPSEDERTREGEPPGEPLRPTRTKPRLTGISDERHTAVYPQGRTTASAGHERFRIAGRRGCCPVAGPPEFERESSALAPATAERGIAWVWCRRKRRSYLSEQIQRCSLPPADASSGAIGAARSRQAPAATTYPSTQWSRSTRYSSTWNPSRASEKPGKRPKRASAASAFCSGEQPPIPVFLFGHIGEIRSRGHPFGRGREIHLASPEHAPRSESRGPALERAMGDEPTLYRTEIFSNSPVSFYSHFKILKYIDEMRVDLRQARERIDQVRCG
jgi:hypothetical protein